MVSNYGSIICAISISIGISQLIQVQIDGASSIASTTSSSTRSTSINVLEDTYVKMRFQVFIQLQPDELASSGSNLIINQLTLADTTQSFDALLHSISATTSQNVYYQVKTKFLGFGDVTVSPSQTQEKPDTRNNGLTLKVKKSNIYVNIYALSVSLIIIGVVMICLVGYYMCYRWRAKKMNIKLMFLEGAQRTAGTKKGENIVVNIYEYLYMYFLLFCVLYAYYSI